MVPIFCITIPYIFLHLNFALQPTEPDIAPDAKNKAEDIIIVKSLKKDKKKLWGRYL